PESIYYKYLKAESIKQKGDLNIAFAPDLYGFSSNQTVKLTSLAENKQVYTFFFISLRPGIFTCDDTFF
ncbi:MAG TPA: hypothetical protein VFZ52_24580, partial [Chryseolinea sp.]